MIEYDDDLWTNKNMTKSKTESDVLSDVWATLALCHFEFDFIVHTH